MQVLLAISTLGAGGAERVITILANELSRRGHQVTLLTLDRVDREFFESDVEVNRIGLSLVSQSESFAARLLANFRRIAKFRRTIVELRPDVVVSFITEMNVTAVISSLGLGVPVVVSERVDPREHSLGRTWSLLRWVTYRYARALVVQTSDLASWCREHWGVSTVIAIPNPLGRQAVVPPASPSLHARPFLLAVGRLDRQKGFDVLIQAFSLLAPGISELDLLIAGDGPELSRLRLLAHELRVSDRVVFLGQVRDVRQLMAGAFAFVLSSRYEGFPNVLLEALSSGAATIATDCRSGPSQILQGGQFGLLVPPEDPLALAKAAQQLWSDAQLHARLRATAREAVRPFLNETVLAAWEQTLARIVHR